MTRQTAVKIFKAVILWGALFALMLLMFKTADLIGRIYPSYSLRYSSKINGQTAEKAVRYINSNSESGFDHAFWKETTAKMKSEINTLDAKCVYYTGKSQLVWPARFISGGYPGDIDAAGCAVSSELAWRLWGSLDVLDMPLEIDGREYKVRGVFEDKQEIALAGSTNDIRDGWNAAELSPADKNTTANNIKDLASASGLGTPDSIVDGPAISSVANAAAYLLPVALIIFSVFVMLRMFPSKNHLYREVMILGLLLIFALFLPDLLDMLPPSMIPGRWSDFSFWTIMRSNIMADIKNYFLLVPFEIDAVAKFSILKQLILLFAGIVLMVMLVNSQKNSRINGEAAMESTNDIVLGPAQENTYEISDRDEEPLRLPESRAETVQDL